MKIFPKTNRDHIISQNICKLKNVLRIWFNKKINILISMCMNQRNISNKRTVNFSNGHLMTKRNVLIMIRLSMMQSSLKIYILSLDIEKTWMNKVTKRNLYNISSLVIIMVAWIQCNPLSQVLDVTNHRYHSSNMTQDKKISSIYVINNQTSLNLTIGQSLQEAI